MGRPTPETGGGTPQNQGLSEFKPLAKERRVGWSIKKPEEQKQQPADPTREAFERFLRSTPMRPAAFRGHERLSRRRKDSEQRGEGEPFQPVPAEQQARERLGKPPPKSEKPGEQRGAAEPSKPNAAEQQTPQRRRTRRELARLAQDPELRGLAKELFGGITDEAASEFIALAVRDFPELTPDEALRKFDRESREGPNRGFTFS